MEPGPPSLEGQGATVDVFSVDGESFRISTTASQGVHRRRFLALMVGAPGSPSSPPRGSSSTFFALMVGAPGSSVRHVSYSSRSCLPAGEGYGVPRVVWLRILPPCQEGSGAATAYLMVSCGPQASIIKKSLADLPVQLGTHVLNTRAHVSNVPDVRAIVILQVVRAGCTVNACKTCGHAAIVQCRPCWPLAKAPLQCQRDPTGQCHTADRAQRGRRQDWVYPMPLKTSFVTPSH
jgi:hypothetical protein